MHNKIIKRIYGGGFANRMLYSLNKSAIGTIQSLIDKEINYFFRDSKRKKKLGYKDLLLEIFLKRNIVDIRKDLGLPRPEKPKGIAVHFRGGDFYHWKKHSIIPVEWYIKSILSLENKPKEIFLFTDDHKDPRVELFRNSMLEMAISVISDNSTVLSSWFKIYTCEKLFSSPSTFSISAALIGGCEIYISENYLDIEKTTSLFWRAVYDNYFKSIKRI